MSLIVKKREYENLDEGLHNVTITRIEDLGQNETPFGTKDQARIYFEAADQKDKEGKPLTASMKVNKSLHPKSGLGKLLAALGIPVSVEFDLNDIIGIKCQIFVQHKENDGKTYANITSVIKLKKDKAQPTPESF